VVHPDAAAQMAAKTVGQTFARKIRASGTTVFGESSAIHGFS